MTEKEISKLTYEQAITELEKVVESLESGSIALEQSIELYSFGALLKKHCLKKLQDAEEKVSVIIKSKNSDFIEEKPFRGTDQEF